ncbi:MAG: hypothetical protein RL394_1327, partial [Bacteroidota bacterium]
MKTKNFTNLGALRELTNSQPKLTNMMNRRSARMFHLFFALCAILVSTFASAQGTYDTNKWRFSNPKPFGFTVIDVEFLDDNNILGVG